MPKFDVTLDATAAIDRIGSSIRRGNQKRFLRYSLLPGRTAVEFTTGDAFFGLFGSFDPKRRSIDADLSIVEGYESDEFVGQVNFAAASEHDGRAYPATMSMELWPDAERFNELWRIAIDRNLMLGFRFKVTGMNYIGAPDGSRAMWDIEKVGKRLDIVESSWSAYLGNTKA